VGKYGVMIPQTLLSKSPGQLRRAYFDEWYWETTNPLDAWPSKGRAVGDEPR
jgi:hypothetical protein